ncbi:MAG TPA: hypothetical protein PK376_09260 [Bacteroidales bacterium]|nr:hypothetical protein [Bacteroidales bacterium]HPW43978.1 hypothetical protein [Bacteroidales bacterium]
MQAKCNLLPVVGSDVLYFRNGTSGINYDVTTNDDLLEGLHSHAMVMLDVNG